jgi:hypothetical protein
MRSGLAEPALQWCIERFIEQILDVANAGRRQP